MRKTWSEHLWVAMARTTLVAVGEPPGVFAANVGDRGIAKGDECGTVGSLGSEGGVPRAAGGGVLPAFARGAQGGEAVPREARAKAICASATSCAPTASTTPSASASPTASGAVSTRSSASSLGAPRRLGTGSAPDRRSRPEQPIPLWCNRLADQRFPVPHPSMAGTVATIRMNSRKVTRCTEVHHRQMLPMIRSSAATR